MAVASNVLSVVLILLGFDFFVTVGVLQVVAFGLPFVVYLLVTRQSPRKVLTWRGMSWKNTLVVTVLSFLLIPAVHLLAFVTSFVFAPVTMDINFTAFPLWLTLLVIGVFPSVFEEIWFRGIMYTEYQSSGIPLRKIALVTALFFGLMHMNFHQAIYTAVFGFVWIYMLYYTRSILAPMLAHFINNGLTVVLQYVDAYEHWYDGLWANPLMFLLIIGGITLVTLPLVYFCMKLLRKHHANTEPEVAPEMTPEPEPAFEDEMIPTPAAPRAFTKSLWAAMGVFLFMCVVIELILRFS